MGNVYSSPQTTTMETHESGQQQKKKKHHQKLLCHELKIQRVFPSRVTKHRGYFAKGGLKLALLTLVIQRKLLKVFAQVE